MTDSKTIYAFLNSFPRGVNSYEDTLLLTPDQLSWATNASVRGDFVTQRPNFFNLTLNDTTGGAFQAGLFQGAAYYRTPTNGYIMVAVNGNLFQISINADSMVATITQISTPQQNSTTAVKNALWQSERFLIWSDGLSLPTFYDGQSSRLSLGSIPTPIGSTAADFNIPAINQYVIGSATTPVGNVPINAPWDFGQGMVLIGSALYYVAGWSGGGGGGNTTLGLAALSSTSGLIIPVGTEAYTNSAYCGTILDAFGADGVTPITAFPPLPVAGTPGDQLVLKILTPATIAANTVPTSNAVASSKYYAGTILSATVGGSAATNYPAVPNTTIVVTITGGGFSATSFYVGKSWYAYQNGVTPLNSPLASGTCVGVNSANSLTLNIANSGQGSTSIANVIAFGSHSGVNGNFGPSTYSVNWNVSTFPPAGGYPNYVVLTLSQNFAGAVGDTLEDSAGNTMTVSSISGATVTCQMVSNSMAAIPFNTLLIDTSQPQTALVTFGTVITGGVVVPAAGNNMTINITAANIPTAGQVVYFTANITAGGTQLVVAQVVSATGGTFGGNTNYFQLELSAPFKGNVGDTLNIGTTVPGVVTASFIVTQTDVGSQNMIQCQMNTAAAVGYNIPITGATPSSITATVIDVTAGSGVLTGVGVIQSGGTGTTTYGGGIVISVPSNFNLVDLNNLANESQIIQITVGSTNYLFWVISVTGGSSGGGNSILLQNINDTAGSQLTGTAATPTDTSIQNFVPAGTFIYTIPEIPICEMGCYGKGRNWIALADGISYVASDTVGSSTGSQQYGFTDAVLKVSQNYFLAGGGTFKISGAGENITAMQFVAQIDASLGQGALQIFTDDTVFSNDAPPDLTTWSSLTSPIQVEGLIGSGAISQDAVVQQNNDLIFRLSNGGVQSMLMASQNFNQWGNTPISNEVLRAIENDNPSLLPFCSMSVFNNRMLMTCQFVQAGRGVYGAAIVSLNFDAISSLQGKSPTVWEGQWTGLNVLKIITGKFNGQIQCFALCLSSDLTKIEVHQIQLDNAATLDNGLQPVAWSFESPMLFKEPENPSQPRLYKRLVNGEFSVFNLSANVAYQVFYRSDQNPNWTLWYSSTIVYQGASDPGYRRRIPIGMPNPKLFDATNNQPLREGYNFQVMFVFTGDCTFTSGRIAADVIPEPEFAQPK